MKKIKPGVVSGGYTGRKRVVREKLSDGGRTFDWTPDCQILKAPRASGVSLCLKTQLALSSKVLSQLVNTVTGGPLNHSHRFPPPLSSAFAKISRGLLLPNPRDNLL